MQKKVFIENKYGEKLAGLVDYPEEKKDKYPAVILVHGFGMTKDEGGVFIDFAKFLRERGFVVVRFDFSGRGDSEGNHVETSLYKQIDELKLFVNFMKNHKDVRKSDLTIVAQSFGTVSTICLSPKVSRIILVGTVENPLETLSELFGDGYNPSGISCRAKADNSLTKVGPLFWKNLNDYDLSKKIRGIKAPILFIHGKKDSKVPISGMRKLFSIAQKAKKREMAGMDHGWYPYEKEIFNIIEDYIRKT